MPRSKTPKKTSKASAGPIDLSDPLINLAVTVGVVATVSICWNNGMSVPTSPHDLTDGSLFKSITDNSKELHAVIPFSFMFLLHCLNSAKSSGGFWAADIVNCVFGAFGGLMMKDLLAGKFLMPAVFGNGLALLITCWYVRNHDVPFTKFNLWNTINDNVSKFVPLDNIMNLCTLMFNISLLHEAANQQVISQDLTADAFYGNIVVLAGAITWSVAHHCAGDFFSTDGFAFNVEGCSAAAERATLFAFWYATNGLANLPILGGALGGVTSQVEGVFGSRANFLNMYVIIYALAGDLIPFNLQTIVQDALYKVFGVSN